MTARLASLLAASALAAAAVPARAQLRLDGVRWEAGRVAAGRVADWQAVQVVENPPPKLRQRLRVRLLVRNDGSKPVEGVLVRYSLTARVSSAGGPGVWAIPFSVDEKHVPIVGAGKAVEVFLDGGPALDLYARRLAREGWWLDRLKVQAMVEPRAGETTLLTSEQVLEFAR